MIMKPTACGRGGWFPGYFESSSGQDIVMPALAPVDELGWTVREPLFRAGSPRYLDYGDG